jgi:hypothetical protein
MYAEGGNNAKFVQMHENVRNVTVAFSAACDGHVWVCMMEQKLMNRPAGSTKQSIASASIE